MKVFRNTAPLKFTGPRIEPCVLTIGNFDGCHRGHQKLISRVQALAKFHGYSSMCLSFDPNPKQFFRPEQIVGKLFQSQQKIRAIEELGLNFTYIQEFNQEFSQITAIDFYQKFLREQLNAKAIVVGHDFRFGRGREGNFTLLAKLALEDASIVEEVAPQTWEGEIISSSNIRKELNNHNIKLANALLGRPYLIEGPVVSGRKLGRKLGFPTANILTGQQLLPAYGVYAALAIIDSNPSIFNPAKTCKPCVVNIGRKPTIDRDSREVNTEVHILSNEIGADQLYGENLGIYLKHFIRHEQKFDSIEDLKKQITSDCSVARRLL